jgi:hypothetical protein
MEFLDTEAKVSTNHSDSDCEILSDPEPFPFGESVNIYMCVLYFQ